MLTVGPLLLNIFVGNGFEGSYLPLRIITPLILIIGIEQILVIQILMAMHHDNIVLRNSLIGAFTAFLFNILLTSNLGAIGSSIVWVIAECIIMIASMGFIYKRHHYLIPFRKLLTYSIAYTPLLLISIITYYHFDNDYLIICIISLLTATYTIITEVSILKNSLVRRLLKLS